MTTFDSELRAHNERLRAAAAVRRGDRVLDVGCGAGQTTREAARAAAPATVLGVDVSAPMLERARELSAAEGFDNVTYEQGDAQTHPFAPSSFDLAISRFGTMFFADPVAAFANIAGALRPGARLVLLVWQAHERNEWAVAIDTAVGATPTALEAFSLGDPDATARILERAGFDAIGFDEVREPVFYGDDVEEALAWVRGFTTTADALAALDRAGAARALDRLRAALAEHHGDDGVFFDSRSWLVTARRSG